MKRLSYWSVVLSLFTPLSLYAATSTLVPTGAVWRYLDNGSNQGTAWIAPSFDDSSWKSGPAQLGYGDGDEATIVSYGPNSSAKYITTYLRRSFQVGNPSDFTGLTLRALRDDGVVIYLNGQEVYRNNMPSGTITYTTLASTAVGGADETTFYQASVSPSRLVSGGNVLAVELHQANGTSSDLGFDLELTGALQPITITLNSPADSAIGVNSPATLQATAVDPQGDNLTMTFYGRPAGTPPGPDFTIAVVPDTQYYVSSKNGGLPAMFVNQTEWILTNKQARNIVYVPQLGDCVENGDTFLNEWLHATNALYRLEDPVRTLLTYGLPYGVAVGNHDQSPLGDANGTTIYYNQFFGEAHFSGRDYYGGHYGTNNDNSFELFSASGLDFIVIYFEYDTAPDTPVLNWANNLLQTYSSRRAIIVSHWLMGAGEQAAFSAQGQATYNALRGNPNLFLMLCGHVLGEGKRQDTFNGNTVHTVMSDYQGRAGGGNGWMRLMEFSPSNNLIRVSTYSPWLNQWETDADSQFTLTYNMQNGGPPFTAVATNFNVPSGGIATATWRNLAPSSEYEWYVTTSDGVDSVSSATRRFTASAAFSPVVAITSPANNASFTAPTDVVINAAATDEDGTVAKVEFYEGASKVGESLASPYTFTWPAVPAGSYALRAVAIDNTGLNTTSAPVNITVTAGATNLPPNVLIASPANGATFTAPATVVINADASDDGAIMNVEFFQGAVKLGEDTTSPYTFVWSAAAPGDYVLTAVAHDDRGLTSTSAPVGITVVSPPDPTVVTRGPYLQLGTPNSVIVRWRTDLESGTRLRYGLSPGNWLAEISDSASTNEHIVQITGLQPNTKYYYEIGTLNGWFASSASDYFVTAPTAGSARSTRVWVLGDSGTADANAAHVRNAYLNFTGARETDLWLMLGDNAYNNGTDLEYQNAVFNMYPTVLQNTVLWSTIGNHDTAGSANPPDSLPYFSIFTLPTSGDAGGIASGTEKYYSFDYANIHFVCLDSMTSVRLTNGPMLTWLQSDLASTTQEWVIAFWHHPPYSKGSHNSDTEIELMQMRTNALPILESYGVDLALGGHSHSYERSFLLDGHYGLSTTLNSSMIKDAGDGRESGLGAYQKPALLTGHAGAVYAVAGSSGKISGGSLNHPAMFLSLNVLGSVVLDINSNRLDATFLDTNAVARDTFTIIKTPPAQVAPAAPTALAITTLSSTEITLAWTDNSTNEDGFEVERSLDGINFAVRAAVGVNVTNGVDTGLNSDTTYYYRVRAFNTGGYSDYSNVGSATTLPPAPPAPPSTLTAVALDARVDLTWSASSGATGYNVKRAGISGGPYTVIALGVTFTSFSDSALQNGTLYFYVVSAVNAAGEGADSAEVTATPQAPPPAPTALAVIGVSTTEIDLTWTDNASNETGFRIDRSGDGSTFTQIGEVAADVTAFSDTGLTPSTLYYYRVHAFNGSGASGPDATSASTLAPAPPNGLTAIAGNAQVTLSWSPAAGASSYNVKRSTTAGGPYSLIASAIAAMTYTDASVQNGTTYFYVVSAIEAGVESANSSGAVATPEAPPNPPLNLTAAPVSISQIDLLWNDVSANETGFRVERSLDAIAYATIATLGANATSYSDTQLNPSTAYHYRVRAFNGSGDSAPAEASATTLAPPPVQPTGLTATGGERSISLSWIEAEGAESYYVKRSQTPGGPYGLIAYGIYTTSYTDNNVAPGVTYFYVVAGVNSGGEGPDSTEASARALFPPNPPTDLNAYGVALDQIDLFWGDNSTDETAFHIERSADGVNYTLVATVSPDVTVYSDIGLDFDTTYLYRVRALNADGASLPALASGTTLVETADTPPGFAAIAADGVVSLSWQPGTYARRYNLRRATVSGGPYALIAEDITALAFDDTSVANGTTYYYVVSSTNSVSESSISAEVSATPRPPAPVAPANLAATAGEGQVSLVWTASARATSYNVKRATSSGGPYAIVATGLAGTSFTDNDVVNGTTYFYVVSAVNDGGESPNSPEASATPTVNNPPIAADDAFNVNEDNPLSVAAPGVLGNDTDAEDPLSAVLVSNVTSGSLNFSANGSFIYTPNANFNGTDSFRYKASDGTKESAPATVTITVSAVNDGSPIANADTAFTDQGLPVRIQVLSNDTDADGDTLSVMAVTQGSAGTVTLNADNSLTYRPNGSYSGQDSFTYTVTDGLVSSVGTVTVTVNKVLVFGDGFESGNFTVGGWAISGQASVDVTAAHSGSYGALLKRTATITKLLSSIDAGTLYLTYWRQVNSLESGEVLRAEISSDNQNWVTLETVTGTTAWSAAAFEIIPTGSDLYLRFTLNGNKGDDAAMIDEVEITATAAGANGAPVAQNDSHAASEDTALTVAAPGVLSNDSDPENDPLIAVLAAAPNNGAVTLNADGSFIYTPNPNFDGSDSFTYRARDGAKESAAATVTITVVAVNDAPVANADAYSMEPATILTIAVPGVLANDIDADSGTLIASLISGPANGSFTLNPNGSFTYTPNPGFTGVDSFNYAASDGSGGVSGATVSITVSAITPAIRVQDISMAVQANGNRYQAVATILVYNQNEVAQAGVRVVGDWYFKGSILQTGATADTDGSGNVALTSPLKPARSGDVFTFRITGLILTGYTYDAPANTMSENSVAVP